jgi:hypothetical protein
MVGMSDFVNYTKRSVELPPGCKDLIDVLRVLAPSNLAPSQLPWQPPNAVTKVLISEPILVGQLAPLLGQKPITIIADLMELGVFANLKQELSFETACKVAQKYGLRLEKPA